MTNTEQRHIFLDENTTGRDFVVSDLHGYRKELDSALTAVAFNPKQDRLISVGDLIDRGPDSINCLDLLEEPWFFSVMGNHEQLLIEAVEYQTDTMWSRWLANGGSWSLNLSDAELENYKDILSSLPLTITIPLDGKLIGICHAEFNEQSWLSRKNASEQTKADWLWGRNRVKQKSDCVIDDIDWVFSGHTIVPEVTCLGNSVFIECGAYRNNPLSLIDLRQWIKGK